MNTKTVLICDDDEGILDVVSIVLEDQGYNVVTVMNSNEIFHEIERANPVLILLDLWMPGLTGEQITARLKKSDQTKNIPVIIISASKDAQEVARVIGADDCINKPFDIHHLEKVVEKFVPLLP